ncbi:MAG TPA: tetratricopeptide repeat protein [Oligoflexia bacterium]|nr:tetratricopeptide repeat protein [Oligoflexia bacterium]
MPIIGALLLAFKAWMLIDAVQRSGGRCCGGSSYWFIICWIPLGDWVYFFAVKIHDPEYARLWKQLLLRPPALDDIRSTFKSSPSAANKLALARALHDHDQFPEAANLAEELVRSEPGNKHYQFLQASCLIGLKQDDSAAAVLEALLAKDFSFRNYDAASLLASLYAEQGQPDKAIEFSRRIIRSSSQLRHRIDLVCLLAQNEQRTEARQIIENAIDEFRREPKFIQRRDRAQLRAAIKLQKMLCSELRT